MNLDDNNFKHKLLRICNKIVERETRKTSMMVECVSNKLTNSVELYEQDLLDTCRYVMMRNPLVMVKDFTVLGKSEEIIEGDNDEYGRD